MHKILAQTAVASLLLGLGSVAVGQSLTASETTAVINATNHETTVAFAPGATPTNSFNFDLNFDTSRLTFASVAVPAGVSCNGVATPGTVRCLADGGDDGSNLLPLAALNITIRFNVGATAGVTPLTLAGVVMTSTSGASQSPTLTNGQVDISNAPPTPLTLSYNPAPGALILPSGNAGTTVSRDIVATAAGNSGSASLSCTAAAGFTVTPNLTFNAAGDQNIAVGCTLGASVVNGNITCTEIDGDSVAPGATRTWTATCPQGGVVPVNPTITTVTATGAFAMPSGALGQTVSRLIDFSASGGAGTGSATINCTATAPVTVTPAMQTVTGSAQPTDVAVRLQLTNAAQGPFDVVCTVTSGSTVRTDTFNVTAAAGTALPPPTVVPASSTWSQLLLIALMAGLGLAFVGFRRQS
jgi:hypothetical protein